MTLYANRQTAALLCLAIVALGFFFLITHESKIPQNAPVATSTLISATTSSTNNVATSTKPVASTTASTTLAATSTNQKPEPLTSAQVLSNMHLTFEDNFNTLSRYLDDKNNITCNPGGHGIWQSVYHFCSRTIPSNFESEIYIDQNFIDYLHQSINGTTTITNPVWVKDGILTIEAKPSDAIIQKAAGPWAKYTSGLLTTQFSFSQQYGYFEMRAQVPAGEGVWPAFWLLPIDKSWPPEIDVMESFGGKNKKNEGGLTTIHYASHTVKSSGLCGKWHDVGVDITKGFHTYGVNWQKDSITYFFDGVAYASCPGNPDANQPFYLLVNLAIGSEASWPGAPDATNKWPVYMYVDYVRAYQTN